jgi:hypothetical protein
MTRTKKFFKYNNTRFGGWVNWISESKSYTERKVFTIKNPPPMAKFIYDPNAKCNWKFAAQGICDDSWIVKLR